MILQFSVNNQKLTRHDESFIVERSLNYLKCEFLFSDEWKGLTKIALFLPANETVPIPVIIDDSGVCNMPKKISYYGGQCKIAVLGGTSDIINDIVNGIGIDTENLSITTNVCRISFNSTISIDAIGEDGDVENPFFELIEKISETYEARLEASLDNIIEIQNTLIGGGNV